ncbi:similar to Saccharomyces cerevisiae YOR098C NUP1 Nuclear pore complex (NPC) subunit [Maudiozyma saulgeensis]|uniref:Similar to Saccharomyces cerevisiae YOR098C NUP1 Nuclear pore complex (NPC) subunit n=1 Tax=Maudiozyma saulgeensis TaxID=1789683 RepID=A0A1X7QZX9_9SACH|nr:similar to Saccharomyces cerevisiae YOR098C NUP1 Nuclear pore complex (NPC) subunit [Kazachstania saulgeensis]
MSSITASSPSTMRQRKRGYPRGLNIHSNNDNDINGNEAHPISKKRSISSTLMSLFKKDPQTKNKDSANLLEPTQTQNKYLNNDMVPDLPSSSFLQQDNVQNYKVPFNSENTIMKGNGNSILLYESEDNSRPPVLPLLPIQRLRLLRQKQAMRLQSENKQLESMKNIKSRLITNGGRQDQYVDDSISMTNNNDDDTNNINNNTVIYHKSFTPSPIKNIPSKNGKNITGIVSPGELPPIALKTLQNKNKYKKRQNKNKGSVWAAAFEYDVSEKPEVTNEIIHNTVTITDIDDKNNNTSSLTTKLKPDSLFNYNNKPADNKKISLTSTQRNLLQNGTELSKNKTATITSSSKSLLNGSVSLKKLPMKITSNDAMNSNIEKKNSTVLLPTVGFDFIKDNDTPSKKSPVAKPLGINIDNNLEDQKIKPSFSFNTKSNASITKPSSNDTPLPKLSFNLPKSTTSTQPSVKAPFSFGLNKPLSSSNENVDEEEPRRKKRAQPDISIDLTKGTDKPIFSFGNSIGNDITTKETTPVDKITPTQPSFSFGASKVAGGNNTKVESSSATEPSFSFGTKPAVETNVKPSFSFGAKPSQDSTTKPSFSFGTSVTKPNEQAPSIGKTAPAFSFGTTSKVAETDKVTDKPTLPSFTFGADNNNKDSATTEKPIFPNVANSVTSSKETSTTPSFSFGAKPAVTGTVPASDTSKPSFSFTAPSGGVTAAKESTDTTQKPSFSFGKPATTLGNVGTSDKPAVPGFNFGTKGENSAISEPKPTPLFGASNTTSAGSSATPVNPSFTFGKKPEEAKSTTPSVPSTTGFTFQRVPPTVGSTTTNPLMGTSNVDTGNAPSMFTSPPTGFNVNQDASNNPLLNNKTIAPSNGTPAFNFGMNNNTNNQNNVGGSVFQTNSMGNNSSFNFGAQNQMSNNISQPPSQPAFNPSTTANFNFGSAGGNPAAIFSSSGSSIQPQQIFGGSSNGSAMDNSNINSSSSPAVPGFKGRRVLARMRAPRR